MCRTSPSREIVPSSMSEPTPMPPRRFPTTFAHQEVVVVLCNDRAVVVRGVIKDVSNLKVDLAKIEQLYSKQKFEMGLPF